MLFKEHQPKEQTFIKKVRHALRRRWLRLYHWVDKSLIYPVLTRIPKRTKCNICREPFLAMPDPIHYGEFKYCCSPECQELHDRIELNIAFTEYHEEQLKKQRYEEW